VKSNPYARESGSGTGIGRVLLLGDVPDVSLDVLLSPSARVQRVAAGDSPSAEQVSVASLIELGKAARSEHERVLILTDRDLFVPECETLFGYAAAHSNVAIVSTFYLRRDCDAARLRERLQNEIAHELAHLNGLQHCKTPGCLMHSVREAAELDGRAVAPCGKCPSRSRRRAAISGLAVAAVLMIAAVLGMDAVSARLSGSEFNAPFT